MIGQICPSFKMAVLVDPMDVLVGVDNDEVGDGKREDLGANRIKVGGQIIDTNFIV